MKKYALIMLLVMFTLSSCNSGAPTTMDLHSSSSGKNSQLAPTEPLRGIYEGISVIVIQKNNIDQDGYYFGDFIEMVYVVENDTDKDVKSIEGSMCVTDMLGESLLDMEWDIRESIPANSNKTFEGVGISYKATTAHDNEKKLYNADYDSLVFEYELKTVTFKDGPIICDLAPPRRSDGE